MLIMTGKNNKATYKNWCIVINLPNEKSELFNSPNLTIDILKLLIDYYKGCKCYLILHDKDKKEDGELKTLHLHCVLLLEKRRSKENIINDISTKLKIPPNCVSVDDCRSIQGSIRYLVHYEEADKYQYPLEDIKSNDKKYNKYFLDIDDYLLECESLKDFVKDFGVDTALKYSGLYDKLLKERNETPEQLKTQLRAVQNVCNAKNNEIDILNANLKKYQENYDILKKYVLNTLSRNQKSIFDYVKDSDGDLITWVKNQFKE